MSQCEVFSQMLYEKWSKWNKEDVLKIKWIKIKMKFTEVKNTRRNVILLSDYEFSCSIKLNPHKKA